MFDGSVRAKRGNMATPNGRSIRKTKLGISSSGPGGKCKTFDDYSLKEGVGGQSQLILTENMFSYYRAFNF